MTINKHDLAVASHNIYKVLVFTVGQDPSQLNRKHVFSTDRRSEQQQIDDLLNQIHDEVEIDSHGIDPEQVRINYQSKF